MPRTALSTLSALFAIALAAGAAADTIYKVRLKDGSIEFTDKPPAGAVVLEKREGPPPPAVLPAPSREAAKEVDERLQRRSARLDEASSEVASAELALKKAKADLEQGLEPLPGERIGIVGKRRGVQQTRLTEAYEARIQLLRKAVADAEARLAKAIDARAAVR